ncbi:MAG: endonuclease domain-containing protein [Prevotella sp.]|nr:endonuclease domain-containing protein [Prevotella sp.]
MGHGIQTTHPDRYALLKEYAKRNRREMTTAESVMWEHLRTMKGLRFRRQHPIGDYIADFICLKKKLVIEIDGGYHESQEQRYDDNVRTEDIERLGYSVIRFTNEAVLYNIQQVLLELNQVLQTK